MSIGPYQFVAKLSIHRAVPSEPNSRPILVLSKRSSLYTNQREEVKVNWRTSSDTCGVPPISVSVTRCSRARKTFNRVRIIWFALDGRRRPQRGSQNNTEAWRSSSFFRRTSVVVSPRLCYTVCYQTLTRKECASVSLHISLSLFGEDDWTSHLRTWSDVSGRIRG